MERLEREYEILRWMTPEKKLAVMRALIRQAYELKAASISSRLSRPDGGGSPATNAQDRRQWNLTSSGSSSSLWKGEAVRSRFGHFNLIHHESALRADVYLLGDDPLYSWAFGRRHRLAVGSTSIWIAPIEYVILRELEYFQTSGSERHLRDVAMMLRISGDSVNRDELESWIEQLGLQQAMDTARSDRNCSLEPLEVGHPERSTRRGAGAAFPAISRRRSHRLHWICGDW